MARGTQGLRKSSWPSKRKRSFLEFYSGSCFDRFESDSIKVGKIGSETEELDQCPLYSK